MWISRNKDGIDLVKDTHFSKSNYDTHEQALETGLKRALEIIKERSENEKDNVQ